MPNWVLIRNPASGRGRSGCDIGHIESRLRDKLGPGETWTTTCSGDATNLARKAVAAGVEKIIAMGGDGTVSEAAQGIIGSQTKLGILPAGTGNDLCRTLGISSIGSSLEAICEGGTLTMDAGRWITDARSGYFVNIAGMGFDAAVASRINQGFRMLRGTSAYVAATLATLRTYKAQPLKITIDDQEMSERVMLAAIANSQFYGGGMKIAPTASITDGVLDVVLISEIGKLEFLRAFPKVFKGNHIGHRAVSCITASRVILEPESEVPFLFDGELVSCTQVEIRVVQAALKVLVPTNREVR